MDCALEKYKIILYRCKHNLFHTQMTTKKGWPLKTYWPHQNGFLNDQTYSGDYYHLAFNLKDLYIFRNSSKIF